nr:putative Gag-Pol polyprotein [Tanacetum cinerariifolium]
MEDEIFFNQSKYIKEMLKKFGLEDSKPTKTPMSTEIKLTKDDEADSVDSSKYQVSKVNVLRVIEMIEHDGRACIYGAFVSVDTNDILTNDKFPILDV